MKTEHKAFVMTAYSGAVSDALNRLLEQSWLVVPKTFVVTDRAGEVRVSCVLVREVADGDTTEEPAAPALRDVREGAVRS